MHTTPVALAARPDQFVRLALVFEHWNALPDSIRAGIAAMVRAAVKAPWRVEHQRHPRMLLEMSNLQ
jgi:hypothetical protein